MNASVPYAISSSDSTESSNASSKSLEVWEANQSNIGRDLHIKNERFVDSIFGEKDHQCKTAKIYYEPLLPTLQNYLQQPDVV